MDLVEVSVHRTSSSSLDNSFHFTIVVWYVIFLISILYSTLMVTELTLMVMKRGLHNKKSKNENKTFSSDQCPICMDAQKTPVRVDCGHLFCLECLEVMFSVDQKSHYQCPMCRSVIDYIKLVNSNEDLDDLIRKLNNTIDERHIKPIRTSQIRIFISLCFIVLLLRLQSYLNQ